MCSESAAVSRDLPMPGSPEISTTRPSPLFACCQRRSKQLDFLLTPDERRLPRAQCLEAAQHPALANDPPGRLRLGKAGERLRPEIVEIEQPADLPARRFGDDQRVRRGQRLQPGGEVRRLADDPALLRRTLADQIADHGEPGGDAEPHAQIFSLPAIGRPPRSPPARRAPPARHRPHAPADSRNRSAPRRPCIWRQSRRSGRPSRRPRGGSRRSARADPPGQTRRERRRADEVAEHHRQLPAFGVDCRR